MKNINKELIKSGMLICFGNMEKGIVQKNKEDKFIIVMQNDFSIELSNYDNLFNINSPNYCNYKIKSIYDLPLNDENILSFSTNGREKIFESVSSLEMILSNIEAQIKEIREMKGE